MVGLVHVVGLGASHAEEDVQVTLPPIVGVAGGVEQFTGVLPDRLEKPIAGGVTGEVDRHEGRCARARPRRRRPADRHRRRRQRRMPAVRNHRRTCSSRGAPTGRAPRGTGSPNRARRGSCDGAARSRGRSTPTLPIEWSSSWASSGSDSVRLRAAASSSPSGIPSMLRQNRADRSQVFTSQGGRRDVDREAGEQECAGPGLLDLLERGVRGRNPERTDPEHSLAGHTERLASSSPAFARSASHQAAR